MIETYIYTVNWYFKTLISHQYSFCLYLLFTEESRVIRSILRTMISSTLSFAPESPLGVDGNSDGPSRDRNEITIVY